MNPILEYLLVFIILFLINYFLFIRNKQKYNKNKIPQELYYLQYIYRIDVKKINYKKFVWIYSLINTFIISTTYIVVIRLLDNFIAQIIYLIIRIAYFIKC